MHASRWLGIGSVLMALAMAVPTGCNKNTRGPTGTINGKLTYKGQPAPKGTVVQFSGDKGGATGTLAADGTFVSMGVRVGKYQVSVAPPPEASFPTDPKAAMEMSLKAQQGGPDPNGLLKKVPEKYRRPEASGVTFEVKEGSNDFALDMKD